MKASFPAQSKNALPVHPRSGRLWTALWVAVIAFNLRARFGICNTRCLGGSAIQTNGDPQRQPRRSRRTCRYERARDAQHDGLKPIEPGRERREGDADKAVTVHWLSPARADRFPLGSMHRRAGPGRAQCRSPAAQLRRDTCPRPGSCRRHRRGKRVRAGAPAAAASAGRPATGTAARPAMMLRREVVCGIAGAVRVC